MVCFLYKKSKNRFGDSFEFNNKSPIYQVNKISKGLFGISIFPKNEQKQLGLRYHSTVFLEELKTPKSPFEINWPLFTLNISKTYSVVCMINTVNICRRRCRCLPTILVETAYSMPTPCLQIFTVCTCCDWSLLKR